MKLKQVTKNGRKMWLADLGTWKGKRERLFRKSRAVAKALITKRQAEIRRDGEAAFDLTVSQKMQAKAAIDILEPVNCSLIQAAEFFIKHGDKVSSVVMKDAVKECIAAKKASGKRWTYVRKFSSHLTSFQIGREDVQCAKVSREMVEAWAWSGKTEKVVPITARSRIIDIGTFFSFCVKRKWCLHNPVESIEPIMLEDKPPGIHTVKEAETLLKSCLEHPDGHKVLPYVALGYFGGLRPAEALKLKPEDIGKDLINVEGEKAKTRRRRLIPINDTLKAWLAVSAIPRVKNFHRDFERVKAGIPWPHDVLRHSFCSYGLPIYGATKIAEWAGHSEQILFAHYRERVKPDDAAKYWALRP